MKGALTKMKKTWTRILSLACVAALVLAFSSCKKDPEDTKSTDPSTSTSDVSTPSTEAQTENGTVDPSASTTAPTTGGASTTAATIPAGGIQKPASAAQAVQVYNDAVAKISKTSGKYSRTMDACKILFIDLMSTDPRVPEKFNQSNATLSGAKLSKLSAGDVSSYSVSESGDNYVITFKLKDIKGNHTLGKGSGGYMYFIDFNEAKGLVTSIADTLTGGSMEIKVSTDKSVVNVSGGSFTATINKKTGKMSKATLSFKQHLEAKATVKSLGISGVAKVDGHGSVTYTVG